MSGKPPLPPKDLGPKYGRHMTVAEMYRRMGDKKTARYHKAAADVAASKHKTAKKKKNKETRERREEEKKGVASEGEVEKKQSVGPIGKHFGGGGDIVTHLLTIRNQVKLYHWQTKRFARHKATDDLTAALDTNIDAFVESYMGRYGRPKVSGSIKLHNFSDSAAKAFVAKETKYLETELPKKLGKADTDLLNMRDTILGDLTKVSYLFTLA